MPLLAPADVQVLIEIRMDDHSRGWMDVRVVIAGGAGLPDRFVRAADQVLGLMRLIQKCGGESAISVRMVT